MNDTEFQELLKRNQANLRNGIPVPCILICNVTGKETKYTAFDYIKGKIEAAGSLEALLKGYKCKGANKDAKGASKAPVVKASKPTTRTWKGEAVDKPIAQGVPISVPGERPADMIHHEFFSADGHKSHTYHPRQHPDQPKDIVHDYRRKDKTAEQHGS